MTHNTTEKVAGILGGMGPEATVDLMSRVIRYTPAQDDIDHVRCIIDNNPKVPSRIKALIEGTGENPGPCMAEMARRLEQWGADFLCIPCNTAHYYYDYVNDAVSIPVLNLLDLTVEQVIHKSPSVKKVGVLCSPAVVSTRMYETRFAAKDIQTIYPEETFQQRLLDVIKAVKAGHVEDKIQKEFSDIVNNVAEQGATLGIIACTELSVINNNLSLPIIDAADVLAKKIVTLAKEPAP